MLHTISSLNTIVYGNTERHITLKILADTNPSSINPAYRNFYPLATGTK